jgi:uncharacterized protein (DUF302 family)
MDAMERTMTTQGRWSLSAGTIMLSGLVLGGVLVSGLPGEQRQGGKTMNESRFTVDHVRVATDRPFEEVTNAFERQLGRFDPEVYKYLVATGDAEGARAKLEAMVGTSGFMLFRSTDHGALLSLLGEKKKAIQYILGNPLIAIQMTRHDLAAGLYAPLRVLVYEDDRGRTCLEYDKLSSLFGQFNDDRIASVASMLDRALEDLIAKTIEG